jgi:hypothetical protein
MRTITDTIVIPGLDRRARGARPAKLGRLGGVIAASLIPAAFWTAVIDLCFHWLGRPLSAGAIGFIAGGIAIFLFLVCTPLMLRGSGERSDAELETATSETHG